MAQQTAVEYLFKQYELTGDISNSQWDKAKRIHKEQTVDAYKHGQNNGYNYRSNGRGYITGEEYFEQTYTQSGTEED